MKINEVGIIGFGRFGKVLADILCEDFDLFVFSHHGINSEKNKHVKEASLDIAASRDAVFLAVQMGKFEKSLRECLYYLKRGSVVIDVCSVKLLPLKIMSELLPEGVHMLLTHPMFGPDSVGDGLKNLPLVLCPEKTPTEIKEYWRNYFKSKGLKVVEMSADEHDRTTAYSLCLTQFLGRIIDRMGIKSTPIDMRSFKNLLMMREISCNDTFELLKDLSNLNPYAKEMRERLKKETIELEKLLEK
jgi:prephenate dehydrogenase